MTSAYRDAVMDLAPAGYWPGDDDLNGASQLLDVSGHGRHATYVGGTHVRGESAIEDDSGASIIGDGTRVARVPDAVWMDDVFLSSYTTLLWFRATDTPPGNQTTRRMVGRGTASGSGTSGFGHSLVLVGSEAFGGSSGRVLFYTASNNDTHTVFTDGSISYRTNSWHFLAGVRDETPATSPYATVRLFLNGELIAERVEPIAPQAHTSPFGILGQGFNDYTDEWWIGALDEPAVIPTPLDADTIRLLYCLGRPSDCRVGWHVGDIAIG